MRDINITETPINHLDKEDVTGDPTIVCPLTVALSLGLSCSFSRSLSLYLSLSLHFDLSAAW